MLHKPGFVTHYRWHAHSDGAEARQVERFVAAKRLVMDRLFDDPQTRTP
jgi:hypothetical protein